MGLGLWVGNSGRLLSRWGRLGFIAVNGSILLVGHCAFKVGGRSISSDKRKTYSSVSGRVFLNILAQYLYLDHLEETYFQLRSDV